MRAASDGRDDGPCLTAGVSDHQQPAAAQPVRTYDVLVIGSGPAGRAAALEASALGRRVGLVERSEWVGGVCVNAGTLPSKTLRAAAEQLVRRHALDGVGARPSLRITPSALFWPAQRAMSEEREAIGLELEAAHVDVVHGTARFRGPRELAVETRGGELVLRAELVVIAVGTVPARPAFVDFDDGLVIDTDSILDLPELPPTVTVVGGGLVGVEYASILAALGVNVTLVERRATLLPFLDGDVVRELLHCLQLERVTLRLGESVDQVARRADGTAASFLESGGWIPSVGVLWAAGRLGATGDLELERCGLEADASGFIAVDANQRTSQTHIYAVGDVAGHANLSSLSAAQGRVAVRHALGLDTTRADTPAFGLHTFPEVAAVGRTEEQLRAEGVRYVAAVASFHELSRSRIEGAPEGFVKLLVDCRTRRLLGVHIIGPLATELIHVADLALALEGTVDALAARAYIHPTHAEAYGIAARRAVDALDGRSTRSHSAPAEAAPRSRPLPASNRYA